MKPVYSAQHATEAHMIRGYLEAQGIDAVVRGEFLTSGIGDLPADVCKVCVADDSRFAEASALVKAFLQGEAARVHAQDAWQCAQCLEQLEGQFTQCWNCGAARNT